MFTFFAHIGIQLNLGSNDFLITPAPYIVGYLRDPPSIVCVANPLYPKECYPYGARDFKKGDVIHFAWKMKRARGVLIYAIVPSP